MRPEEKERTAMKDRLLQLLREEFPEVDFECSDALVDDGILDSLTITGVISAITMEYGISIPYEEIVEENFNSVDAMAAMIERLQDA
jgi:acyl carrier protein